MGSSTDYYLVAFDPAVGYCRLFRTDSIEAAGLAPLWTGRNLRAGYDAMIRLNRERQPTDLYHVCRRDGRDGYPAFRLAKASPPRGWATIETFPTHQEAKQALERLVSEREEKRERDRARLITVLRRIGVPVTTKMPRLSAADRRYIAWLEETGRIPGHDLRSRAIEG